MFSLNVVKTQENFDLKTTIITNEQVQTMHALLINIFLKRTVSINISRIQNFILYNHLREPFN